MLQEKILHYWCQATSGCSNFVDFWAIHLRFGHNDANHEFCWFFENCFVCRSHFWGFPFFIFSDFAETRMPLAQRFSAFQAFRVFSKLNEVSSVRSEFIGVKRKLFHEWKGQSNHFPLWTLRNCSKFLPRGINNGGQRLRCLLVVWFAAFYT